MDLGENENNIEELIGQMELKIDNEKNPGYKIKNQNQVN